ncbi:MAG: AI-2E family transporter [Actinomycetia bacterium]|nr:AI-2E family transporter [Actinomycetes bacterium]MCH9700258.1 AI-2E family transporter [Actinomycetes bacterium]MCH9762121.1 AI-2E family transporter [Actinomycetes bacterium]
MSASLDAPAEESVSPLVRKTAAWSWRLLVILGAVLAAIWIFFQLEILFVPVALATILAALLIPVVDFLDRRGVPRGGAVALVLLSGFAVFGGLLAFVITQFVEGAPALVSQMTTSIDGLGTWLIDGPLHVSHQQINQFRDAAIEALRSNQERLTSGALSTAGTVTEIVTGALLVLFTLIFLLQGGRNIFSFVTQIFPFTVRDRVRDAGRAGFRSLIGYVRATFLVAFVDAVGIGVGLAIMGVPLALPLASLVFMGAFVPLVGAVVAGFVAVVVALIAKGFVYALITLGLIIAVQQLEGHVLQPLVMGRAVSIHPLAIVLVIAGGAVLAGIPGALLAVPALAFFNSAMRVLLADDPDAEEAALAVGDRSLVAAEADDIEASEEPAPGTAT